MSHGPEFALAGALLSAFAALPVVRTDLLGLLGPQDPPAPQDPADLLQAFAREGIQLDVEQGIASLRASVLVRGELLEYLLVGPSGAAHESLFLTEARPSLVNAALLTLGVEPGANARWVAVEPPPTLEERRAGRHPFDVVPPEGDGLFLYVAWREDDETYFFRVEDLIANLDTGRTMRRHRWVVLGSRFVTYRGEELFAADVERNLINVALFREGHTLLTAALPECIDQAIWVANAWLVPPRGSEVEVLFSRRRLDVLPEGWGRRIPILAPGEAEDGR